MLHAACCKACAEKPHVPSPFVAGPKKPEQGRAGSDTFPEPLDQPRGDLRNKRDVAHPVRQPTRPRPPPLPGAATIPKKPKGKRLVLGDPPFEQKVGWEGWLWAAGCRRAGLGLGVQGAQAVVVVRHVTLYPGTLVPPYPRKPTPFLHTLLGPNVR